MIPKQTVFQVTNYFHKSVIVLLISFLQVLLLKHLIDYLADGEDEEFKEFAVDFLNPNSSVSLHTVIDRAFLSTSSLDLPQVDY